MSDPLFKDLLVLDCASFIAGPAAGTIMSDFGARVIKIEPPGVGDSYRALINMPGAPQADRDYFWLLDNRNKESLALDLKQEAGQRVLRELIAKADVFITNFPGPIRQKLKLTADDVLPLNERIIYASLTPYGEAGPEKDRTGYDSTAWWARSGLMMAVRPTADSEPARSVPAMGDHPTAVSLFAAIMTGLYRRQITGKGGMVSTSLLANGLWSNGCYIQAALCGATFQPRAARYHRSALLEVYRCGDGRWFMFSMVNQAREWPALLRLIGKSEWETDPRFATMEGRQANASVIAHTLEDIFITAPWEHWKHLFQQHGVTFGVISEPEDHAGDPQIAANGLLPEFAGENGLRTIDSPIRVNGSDKVQPRPAPCIGQNTRAILQELGYSDAAIGAMSDSGAVEIA
ncbi:MAG: CoA transferase [Alphaproteobacteria bacterium]|nr:CoA transferase [Alphaproteobacteria bacterium]